MAENMIKFLRGSVASLPQTATAGAVYFTKDEGLYLGLEDGTYHRYGDFITVENIAALPENGAHENCMYYCESENVLAKWNGADWVQINKQKTLAELGGVAKSVYEAKIAALEKADTDNAQAIADLDAYVGDIPTGYTETNVIAYINKKAQETLDAASGGSSESAASVLAALNTYKAEIDPKIEANTTAAANAQSAAEAAQDAADAAQATADSKTTMAEVEAKGYQTAAQVQAIADGKDEAIAAAKQAGDNAQADVDALELKVGTVADGKTVVEMIADAQAAATYDDTALVGRVAAVEGDVATIKGDYLKATDKTELSEAIASEAERAAGIEAGLEARLATVEGDYLTSADKTELQGNIDTVAGAVELLTNGVDATKVDGVNDLIKYVEEHGTEVTGMQEDIQENAEAIATIAGDYLKNADKEALQGSIDGVAGRMTTAEGEIDALQADSHTHGNKTVLDGITTEKVSAWDAAEGNAKAHADDLNTAMNTRVEALEAIDHDHANKAELDLIASGDKAKWDAAAAKAHEHANAAELAKIADGDVAKWNAAQANAEATAAAALSAAKTELEGKITAAETAAKGYADTEVGKVQSALNTYKTDNDAAVALKANSADVYKKTETYTQAEVDAAIEAAVTAAHTWGSF